MLHVYGITYDHTTNYGSCLQAYALCKAIEDISVAGEKCSYSLIPIRACSDWPGKTRINPLMSFHRLQFQQFEKRYIHYADVSSIKEFERLNEDGDAFVCGSDVIWNPDVNFSLGAFYLDFARKYKFSYAASFGKAEINILQANRGSAFASLDAISCRETSGCNILSALGYDAETVLDPVLLLDKTKWENVIRKKESKKKYIFVYLTHFNDTAKYFIENLSQKTKLRAIVTAWNNSPRVLLKNGLIQVQKPERWLQLLRDAEYVVTNSFHATAFSVIFHKKFFTVVNGEITHGINIRMYEFLHDIGLERRMMNTVPSSFDLSEIDYKECDRVLDTKRWDSMDFLKRNLQAAYDQKCKDKEKEVI